MIARQVHKRVKIAGDDRTLVGLERNPVSLDYS